MHLLYLGTLSRPVTRGASEPRTALPGFLPCGRLTNLGIEHWVSTPTKYFYFVFPTSTSPGGPLDEPGRRRCTSDWTRPLSDKRIPISCQNDASPISFPYFSQIPWRHFHSLYPEIWKPPKARGADDHMLFATRADIFNLQPAKSALPPYLVVWQERQSPSVLGGSRMIWIHGVWDSITLQGLQAPPTVPSLQTRPIAGRHDCLLQHVKCRSQCRVMVDKNECWPPDAIARESDPDRLLTTSQSCLKYCYTLDTAAVLLSPTSSWHRLPPCLPSSFATSLDICLLAPSMLLALLPSNTMPSKPRRCQHSTLASFIRGYPAWCLPWMPQPARQGLTVCKWSCPEATQGIYRWLSETKMR